MLLNFLLFVFIVGSCFWVWIDARRLKVDEPFGWFLMTVFLWIFAFPFYLYKRPGFKRAAGLPIRTTVGAVSQPPFVAPLGPKCPTCQRSNLSLCQVYRMSSPVVVIGWILLVPSFLGMLYGLYLAVGVPLLAPSLTGGDKEAAAVTASLGIGLGLSILIGSFVGGLLGWLLVMKKSVLQCPSCQTTIAAS